MKRLFELLLIKLGITKGFTRLEYRGIPVIVREDVPENIVYFSSNDKPIVEFNIKTEKVKKLSKKQSDLIKQRFIFDFDERRFGTTKNI
jgi:hypothetical protein